MPELPPTSPKGRYRNTRKEQRIVRRGTRPHPSTRHTTPLEARPTTRPAVKIRPVHHPRKLRPRDAHAGIKRQALCVHIPRECDERDGRRGERGEHRAGVCAEEQGCRAHADLDVVRFVLVRVDRVVHDRPAESARVEGYCDGPVHRACYCCPAQQCAPVERESCSDFVRRQFGEVRWRAHLGLPGANE